MDITFKKDLTVPGYDYRAGQTVKNAEAIFGLAQADYLIETGHAIPAVTTTTQNATAKPVTEKR